MLGKRLLTVAIALPLFAGALMFLPQFVWGLFLLPWLAIAGWEWSALANYGSGPRVAYAGFITISAAVLYYVMPSLVPAPTRIDVCIYAASAFFWFLLAPVWLKTLWTNRNGFVLGAAGWLALVPMWLALVRLQPTPWLLLLILSIVWVADTAAYAAGRT